MAIMTKQEILEWLKSIKTYTVTNIFNILNDKKYKLQKNKNITYRAIEPPKLDYTDKKISSQVQQCKYKDEVERFISTLESKLPEESLKAMYHNLQTLKYNDLKNPVFRIIGIAGAYYPSKNKFSIANNINSIIDNINYPITHELLHMASSKCVNNTIYPITNAYLIGFHNGFIGRCLNEGYTEVLNNRLFSYAPEENKSDYSYIFYKKIAEFIEDIVGEEKMTNLYFDANLKGLFDILSSYSSEKETSVFLKDLDSLFQSRISIKGYARLISKKTLNSISKYLTSLSLNFAKEQVQNRNMSKEEEKGFLKMCKENILSINKYIDDLINPKKNSLSEANNTVIDNNSKQESTDQQNNNIQEIIHDKPNYSQAFTPGNNVSSPQIDNSKVITKTRGNVLFNLIFFTNIILALVITSIYLVFIF